MSSRFATSAYFFLHGLLTGSWLYMSVALNGRIEGNVFTAHFAWMLSVALVPFGMAVGAWAVGVWSVRRVTVWAVVTNCVALGMSVFPSDVALFGWVMALAGLANGAVLVVLNCLAAGVERDTGRLFLPWCHGFLALGGVAGSVLWTLLVLAAVPAATYLTWSAAVGVVVAVSLARFLPETELPDSWRGFSQGFARLALLVVAALGAAETVRQSSPRFETVPGVPVGAVHLVGAQAFAVGMAVGGLVCGVVAARIGLRNLLKAGAVTAAAGLVVLVLATALSVAWIGFVLAGVGLAGVFPVMLSLAAARGSARQSIALLTALGYVGGWLVASVVNDISHEPNGHVLAVLLVVPVLVLWLSPVKASLDRTGT